MPNAETSSLNTATTGAVATNRVDASVSSYLAASNTSVIKINDDAATTYHTRVTVDMDTREYSC